MRAMRATGDLSAPVETVEEGTSGARNGGIGDGPALRTWNYTRKERDR